MEFEPYLTNSVRYEFNFMRKHVAQNMTKHFSEHTMTKKNGFDYQKIENILRSVKFAAL